MLTYTSGIFVWTKGAAHMILRQRYFKDTILNIFEQYGHS